MWDVLSLIFRWWSSSSVVAPTPRNIDVTGSVGTALSVSGSVGTGLSVAGSVSTSISVTGSL